MPLLLLLLLLSSFFLGDEEKELRLLAKSGQKALQEANYCLAKDLFHTFYKRCRGERGMLGWQEYIESILGYSAALEMLGDIKEAEELISSLLHQRPPDEFLPRIKLSAARLLADQSSPEKAYLEMKKLADFLPQERWSKEDLSLFHALSYSLDEHFDSLLKKAKSYFVTGFFEEAKTIYEEVLQAILHQYYPKAITNQELLEKKVRYCLAECHYCMAEYEKTLSLMNPEGSDEIDREMIYLMALCFEKQQEYEQAVYYFQKYLEDPGAHYDHALFEIGYYAYRAGNIEKARKYFEKLQELKNFSKAKWVGALYLSRILLQEKAASDVEKLLTSLGPCSLREDPLKYETFYLLAEAAFMKEEYERAKELYLLAFPQKDGCSWQMQALYRLGYCYLNLREVDRAETIFVNLLDTEQKEDSTFALAQLYLIRGDPDAAEKIERFFAHEKLSLEKEHEAYLLRAKAAKSYEAKSAFLQKALMSCYQHLPSYVDGFVALGLMEFQRGLAAPEEGAIYFESATAAFEKALSLCSEEKLAGEILRLEAKANFYSHTPLTSLKLLEKLLSELMENCPEHEETLYLSALVASKLGDENYLPLAERSFKKLIELYPNGIYAADALHGLGSLYFSEEKYDLAGQTFLYLAEHYPHTSVAAEGWFWAAESFEKISFDPQKIAHFRRRTYQDYPDSEVAAKAYFRLYPYSDYVAGVAEAMAHLKEFPNHFENSALCIPAYYLIAMKEETFEAAESAFQKATSLFHSCSPEGRLPDQTTIYYYYESLHKLACLYLKEGHHLDRAISLLKQISSDFEEKNHPLTSMLSENILYEQARYTLAKAYLESGSQNKAEQIFLSILNHEREKGTLEGLYLSLTWKEQAKLAMAASDFATALSCLNFADEAGNYFLSDEQKLSLWLLKSDCYLQLKDYDNAMRMLSKVINADVTSPIRIKAMYLRAEIYELQERYDLAIRQLDAVTKKGGEWALLAKKKLKESYGVE